MRFFCYVALHRWNKRAATINPGRLVRRCKSCGRVSVVKRATASH